jgi:hypothetical protein
MYALPASKSPGEHSQRAALIQLQLREVGFGKPGIELSWTQGTTCGRRMLDPLLPRKCCVTPLPACRRCSLSKQRKGSAGRAVLVMLGLLCCFVVAGHLTSLIALPVGWLIRFPSKKKPTNDHPSRA